MCVMFSINKPKQSNMHFTQLTSKAKVLILKDRLESFQDLVINTV